MNGLEKVRKINSLVAGHLQQPTAIDERGGRRLEHHLHKNVGMIDQNPLRDTKECVLGFEYDVPIFEPEIRRIVERSRFNHGRKSGRGESEVQNEKLDECRTESA